LSGLLRVTGLRIASCGRRRRAVSGVGRRLLGMATGAGLAVALGGGLATIARLDALPRIVWRTVPLRGKAWRRRLHPGIVLPRAGAMPPRPR
jgi:hypothetical protein